MSTYPLYCVLSYIPYVLQTTVYLFLRGGALLRAWFEWVEYHSLLGVVGVKF